MAPTKPKTYRQRIKEAAGGRATDDKAYERTRLADPVLAATKRFRSSARWQRFRKWFKNRHPVCFNPFGEAEHNRPTEEVHHIVAYGKRPELGLTESNCAPLCTWCHGKTSGMERAGKDSEYLFKKGE